MVVLFQVEAEETGILQRVNCATFRNEVHSCVIGKTLKIEPLFLRAADLSYVDLATRGYIM